MFIGIEIARDALRGVRLSRRQARARRISPGWEPSWTAEVSLAPDGSDGLAGPLAELASSLGPGRATAAVAVPSGWCSYRMVRFPFRSAARVEGALRYALDTRLPQDVETYVVEPLTGIMSAGKTGARVHVAACPADRLERLLGALRNAGLDPCVVQPAVAAAGRWVRAVLPPSTEPLLAIRCAAGECEVTVLRKGEVLACRVLRVSNLDPAGVADRIRFALRSLTLCEGVGGYGRVLMLGAQPAGLADALEREIGRPVERSPGSAGPFAVACGAAMEAALGRRATVNLRQGTYAYPPYARGRQRRMAAALALLAATGGLLGARTALDIAAVRAEMVRLQARQAELFRQVVGSDTVRPNLEAMKARLEEMRGRAAESGAGRFTSCLRRWVDLMRMLPESSGVELDRIDINPRRIAVTARVPDAATAWQFHRRLQRSGPFLPEVPRLERTGDRPDRPYTLTMDLRYR